MALVKENLTVNFGGDLDLKTDPFQVDPENFAAFNNAVRTTGKRFEKRNGFQNLASFSTPYVTNLAVFGGGLLGIGSSVQVYSPDTSAIYSRGAFQPVGLSVLPAIRNSATQTSSDVAIAPNGLALVVCGDSQSGVVYQIIDSVTGSVVRTLTIAGNGSESVGRAFVVGNYFIAMYCTNSNTLQFEAIPYATPTAVPTTVAMVNLGANVYDGGVVGNTLYVCFVATTGSTDNYTMGYVDGTSLAFTQGPGKSTLATPLLISVCPSVPTGLWILVYTYNSIGTVNLVTATFFTISTLALGSAFTVYTTSVFSFQAVLSLTGISAVGGPVTGFIGNSVGPNIVTDYFISKFTCTTNGTVTGPTTIAYQLQIAGRPFEDNLNLVYCFLAFYESTYQPTYFLLNQNGNILGKVAYSNGGQPNYAIPSSSNVKYFGTFAQYTQAQYAYLYQDLIAAVNKSNGAEPGGLYSQSGANIATFTLNQSNIVSSEIGGSLQLSGGFLWMFDGQTPVENNFHVWPDPVTVTTAGGGNIDSANQPYYYQVTYEWTDASGNIHRSAPSIPVVVDGLSGSTNSVNLTISSLGLTAKVAPNPVRIVVYRWSTANQEYYQVSSQSSTSGANPLTINNPAASTQTFVDTLSDSDIIGNNLIYTSGGVIEDIGGPATGLMALFDTRLWLVDAEDSNLLWYSKQVIESTPVEMSDLLTFYVAPTTSSQTSTGPITSLASMDDKLILFKENAIYYINGTGPDNTGANNNYSQPIFITAAVGCSNQKSIVLIPNGLMFQTSQGIWMLGRDLSTNYIGAPVEGYNSDTVTSAVSIPNTTQIRFMLNTGTELVYDYFFQKWDTGTPPTAISSVVYQGLHTFLDASGNIWQEDSGSYVDGSTPVNLSFTTPWYNLAGVQGYERAYYAYLLGQYLSPHILTVQIYYDYSSTVGQTVTLNPNLGNPAGTGPATSLEQFRIFFEQQKCQAVKFTVTESFDSTFGGTAGAGLTLSGINFVLGIKKSYKPISTAQSAG